MRRIKFFLFLIGWMFLNTSGFTQQRDNISWHFFQIDKKIDEQWSASLKPIVRFHRDLGYYQNFSVDYSLGYRLNPSWSASVIGRTWFLVNGNKRQFIWLDIAHETKAKHLILQNKVRLHGALDIDLKDGDFIRYLPDITFTKWKKWQPNAGLDFFFQMNGLNYLQRVRYKAGLKFIPNPVWSFKFEYWNEHTYQPESFFDNVFTTTLAYQWSNKNDRKRKE